MFKRLLFVLLFCGAHVCANATIVTNDIWGAKKTFNTDFSVSENVTVAPNDVYLSQSVNIYNQGLIKTNIHVCDRCHVYVQNSGVIDSEFVLGTDAKMFQVVNTKQDLNAINTNADYVVLVTSDDVLSLSDVVNMAGTAQGLVVENTKLNVDSVPDNKSLPIDIGDNVVLVVNDTTELDGVVLLDNVQGGWSVRFEEQNSDPMYSVTGAINNGRLSINRMRETNYAIVLENDKRGMFLNELREQGGAEKLFSHLDSAPDMKALDDIMMQSARFNLDVLLQPVQTMYAFDMLRYDFASVLSGADAYAITADDYFIYGLNLKHNMKLSDGVSIGVGVRVGQMEYKSDLDDFSALNYGLNLNMKYKFLSDAFVRTDVVAMMSDFDIGLVSYDNNVISNPRALSGYWLTDIGYKFDLSDSFYLTPYVGCVVDYYNLEDIVQSDAVGRVGMDMGYTFEFSGIRYNYDARIGLNNFSDIVASGRIGVWSDIDSFGGDVTVSVISMTDVVSYGVSANLKFAF